MLKNEAVWIGENIGKLTDIKTVLDISGGSWFFRNVRQPWIEKYLFKPLIKKKIKVFRSDSKDDVTKKSFLKNKKFDLVIAANILEHVKDIKKAVKTIEDKVEKGKYLCVSVPYVFPYHPDPVDNMFRPDKHKLMALFADKFDLVIGSQIKQKYKLAFNKSTFLKFNAEFVASCIIFQKK